MSDNEAARLVVSSLIVAMNGKLNIATIGTGGMGGADLPLFQHLPCRIHPTRPHDPAARMCSSAAQIQAP